MKPKNARAHTPTRRKQPKPDRVDDATVSQIIEFVERATANDLPPEPIEMIHHVPRPNRDPNKPHARAHTLDTGGLLIVRYIPSKKRWTQ